MVVLGGVHPSAACLFAFVAAILRFVWNADGLLEGRGPLSANRSANLRTVGFETSNQPNAASSAWGGGMGVLQPSIGLAGKATRGTREYFVFFLGGVNARGSRCPLSLSTWLHVIRRWPERLPVEKLPSFLSVRMSSFSLKQLD